MAKLFNLAHMTTATTGAGTITLGSAVPGFLTFALAGVSDGDTVTYAIRDGNNSEIGRGVYTSSGTTLTRTVLKSTNSDAALNLSGSATVMITPAAEDLPTDLSTFAKTLLDDTTAGNARTTLGAAASGANTDLTSVYLNNTGLKLKDTDASHGLSLVPGSNLTADRALNVFTGDADRNLDLGAWTAYTPTITAASGTFTSASATGRYARIGKIIVLEVSITVTTFGTGTAPVFTLPFAAGPTRYTMVGREVGTTGKSIMITVEPSATSGGVTAYDNTVITNNGSIFVLTGVYEAA